MKDDICPKCSKEGCMCDPNTCDCEPINREDLESDP